uniref:Uncharacterized protein n=1 Tax=Lactuca sativa TaxID=4236 RepID=A0A9R1UT88_LACSA|nr:hypothetical protein LSAT_V11C800401340 [Lactuca sativa]
MEGLVDHFDFVDMDVFSVNELDDMMAVLRYNNKDLENLLDDAKVDMKYFHIHVDEDVEWILKTSKKASCIGIGLPEAEDLEVIDTKLFDSPVVGQDNNSGRMLRDIGKGKACSLGEFYEKDLTSGHKFKTNKDVK